MSILKVARMGHPVLRQAGRALEPTEVRTPAFQKLIDDMVETMHEYGGIGLAGPQVHESVRLFVAGLEQRDGSLRVLPFVNPEITPIGDATNEDWEGCLSIPDIRGKVVRPDRVLIRALDRRAKPFELELDGYSARVVQHERDHLDGVLFFDRMRGFETLTFLDEYSRFWSRDHDADQD